jgi:hypothetical protein
MRDCLLRGEAPFASHGMYTQPGVLRDEEPSERRHGIDAGHAWREVAAYTVVYTDLGVGKGVQEAIDSCGHRIEYRTLGDGWEFGHSDACHLSRSPRIWCGI